MDLVPDKFDKESLDEWVKVTPYFRMLRSEVPPHINVWFFIWEQFKTDPDKRRLHNIIITPYITYPHRKVFMDQKYIQGMKDEIRRLGGKCKENVDMFGPVLEASFPFMKYN